MALSTEIRNGLELVVLANDRLRLTLLPQVGARLISLEIDDHELLWRNPRWLDTELRPTSPPDTWPVPDETMASWVNIGGSKTWPAPQGWGGPDEWAGPPDPVLDSGAYTWVRTGSGTLTMTSAPDPRTGLEVTREVRLPETGRSFEHTARLRNAGPDPVRWAAWEVTQVATEIGGRIEVGVRGGGPVVLLEAEGAVRHVAEDRRVVVPVQPTVAKLGFPYADGHLAWLRADGAALEQSVAVVSGGEYPDGGCPVQLWLQHPVDAPFADLGGLHPDAHLVELETLSPLTTLAPGAVVELAMQWTCTPPPPLG